MKTSWSTKKLGEYFGKIFPFFLITIILSFVLVFGIYFFNKIFIAKDTAYVNGSVGALMGAFFAFLFVRLGDALTRIYERQVKHYNALVKIEGNCNRYLNIIANNIFVIDDFIEFAKRTLNNKQAGVYFNVLHEFSLDEQITLELMNIDFINDVFSFESGIDKMNSSISSINRFYLEIKAAFIQKNINLDSYLANVEILTTKLLELKVFLLELQNENKEVIVKVRILMKKKPFLTKIIHAFSSNKYPSDINNRIITGRKTLEEEIVDISQKSKAKIDDIIKRNNL